ncbi:aminopeptidase N [Conchiformibius kuhniae]|uniref:Aminopeptidase N n=1 Tax=Conchiformibius kuhniae TaxID=211502 RepID=A0ABD8B723_9NEIS|nr:aminopeptidase N [Conchiformibius kuhniae]
MSQTAKFLKDYRAPEYLIERVDLCFDVFDGHTAVTAVMRVLPQTGAGAMRLHGSAELLGISVDGRRLPESAYRLANEVLTLDGTPAQPFELTVQTKLYPHDNTTLMGLYQSGGNLYTQCEPEGFRKITFHPDRPDVMSIYTTEIRADKARFPVLLANGNRTDGGDLPNGRHFAVWHDPFAKPSYLFALVAGDLSCTRDSFRAADGREIAIEFYTRAADADKVAFAVQSLKHAMKWDESRFGLVYDLDIYMVVAVGDFNMGAMENKGLNIFNTKYVLADARTATDADFDGVESVIAHEYFHNWTGNRVTCRDWFQLSLKEGLTVFRDQEFSADRNSRAVRRIHNAAFLRRHQFPEDAGPMAHPIRPASYVEMNNFYTMTVYEKGAEVVRMYHTLLGEDGFQKGMKLYFQRHDGQAVTCDDFRAAMADANGVDLSQFALWYSQAGTPVLDVSGSLRDNGDYVLRVRQTVPPTPDMVEKQPMMMPLKTALLDENGDAVRFRLPENGADTAETVLLLTEAEQEFVLQGVNRAVTPSLLRGFSAPVRLNFPYTDQQLALLLAHDDDPFARWEAGQTLYRRAVAANETALADNAPLPDHAALFAALEHVVRADIDPAFKAVLLTPPAEEELWRASDIDPVRLHHAREALLDALARHFAEDWLPLNLQAKTAEEALPDCYAYSPEAAAWRSLRNLCRSMMLRAAPAEQLEYVFEHYDEMAQNMSHEWGLLNAVNHIDDPRRDALLARFAEKFADQALVLDKYFALIACSRRADTPQCVREALSHPAFAPTNPNKVRALLGTFARNHLHLHAADGAGYRFIAERVRETDVLNPQTAADLVRAAFSLCCRLEPHRRALMKSELEKLAALPELSKDTREIVEKILAG